MDSDNRQSATTLVFHGSDGAATRGFLKQFEELGPLGRIAAQLFRVEKPNSRAKEYQGDQDCLDGTAIPYSDLAYRQKEKAVEKLCELLLVQDSLTWGWGYNADNPVAPFVLYVEVPQGQVSFHSTERFDGPDFMGEWDGAWANAERIIALCDSFDPEPVVPKPKEWKRRTPRRKTSAKKYRFHNRRKARRKKDDGPSLDQLTPATLAPYGVELVDPAGLEIRCRECGRRWWPLWKGKLAKQFWRCPRGCNRPVKK